MIWATVSSWSYFCWLYRASPSLAAKNKINLISVLTIWWCACAPVSLEKGVCYDQPVLTKHAKSLTKLLAFALLYCSPKPNLLITSGISLLPTFAIQSPIMERTSFFGVSSRRSCSSSYKFNFSFFGISGWGVDLDYGDFKWFALEIKLRSFCHFWDCTQVLHFRFFCWLWGLFHFF